MATDLFGTHRILSALLAKEGTIITGGLKSEEPIQKLAKILLNVCVWVEQMDNYTKHDIKESVRRTIMEHDEVFRKQVHELHRLYHVQKSLMAELGSEKHGFQSKTEETQEMVQGQRPNLTNSPSTSETSQSARLGNAPEHLFLHECKPASCLNLFNEETSRNQEGIPESGKSIEGESWSASMGSDLDLKLSIGPSSHATKTPHWLFSGSRERNPSGQHR